MIDAEDLIITNKVISQELTGIFSRGKHIEDIYNYLAEFCVQPGTFSRGKHIEDIEKKNMIGIVCL